MCDPVTLTITAAALAAASGGLSAYGAYQEGKATDKYYKYLANQNDEEANAVLKAGEQKATIAQNEGAKQSADLGRDVSVTAGSQRAAMAANGLSGSVTAADLAGDTFNKAKMDEEAIRYNADSTAWGAKTDADFQAWQLKGQAESYRMAGKNAKRAGTIKMTSSLLDTASSVAGGMAGMGSSGGGTAAVAGKGGYGASTPSGVRDMGTYSKLPRRVYYG